jgi:hypothetical protein
MVAQALRLIVETRVGVIVAVGVGAGVKIAVGLSVGVIVGSAVAVTGKVGRVVAVSVGEPVGLSGTAVGLGATVDTRGEIDCEVAQADTSMVIPNVAESRINL